MVNWPKWLVNRCYSLLTNWDDPPNRTRRSLQRLKRTLLPAEEATPSCLGIPCYAIVTWYAPQLEDEFVQQFPFFGAFFVFHSWPGVKCQAKTFSLHQNAGLLICELSAGNIRYHRIFQPKSQQLTQLTFQKLQFFMFFLFPRHIFISFSKGKDLKLANETWKSSLKAWVLRLHHPKGSKTPHP